MSNTKQLFVNQASEVFPESGKLKEILEKKSLLSKEGVAVAVNQKIIPREKWESFILQENDQILIIGASYGG